MKRPSTCFFQRLVTVCATIVLGTNGIRAQAPIVQPTPVPLAGANSDPNLSDKLLAHSQRLVGQYGDRIIHGLFDPFDYPLHQRFTTTLANARAQGLPEALLTEAEAFEAKYQLDVVAAQAMLPRLDNIRLHWQEPCSLFCEYSQFEQFIEGFHLMINHERTTPGSFARVALGARRRSQASSVRTDLRLILRCVCFYGNDHHCQSGEAVLPAAWLPYAPADSRLRSTGGVDPFGRPYGVQTYTCYPTAPAETYQELANEVPRSFWRNFAPRETTQP